MIPMRRQSIRCHFRKGIDWCSWKLISIIIIMLLLCLTAALTYVAGNYSHIAIPNTSTLLFVAPRVRRRVERNLKTQLNAAGS